MKLIFLLLAALFAVTFPKDETQAGGFTVKNGGGLAEFNFEYAVLKIPNLVQACLQDPRCQLEANEAQTARKILATPQAQLVFKNSVEFSASASQATFLNLLKWQSPKTILVHQTELYPQDKPLTVMQAAAALLTLQAQISGTSSDGRPFASKVLAGANAVTEVLSMKSFGYSDRGFTFIRLRSEALFVFHDDMKAHTLNPFLEKSLECPRPQAVPELLAVENLSWNDLSSSSETSVELKATSKVLYACKEASGTRNFSARLQMQPSLHLVKGTSRQFKNGEQQVKFELSNIRFETTLISEE